MKFWTPLAACGLWLSFALKATTVSDLETPAAAVHLAHTLQQIRHKSRWHQLHDVNNHINRTLHYTPDLQQYQKEDHWAQPFESLTAGRGDCEDYAIAKYAALRALGYPEQTLRFLYVRALQQNEPHMVLAYLDDELMHAMILDNADTEIHSLSERTDLKLIYSFNANGVWVPHFTASTPTPPMSNPTWLRIQQQVEMLRQLVQQ